MRPASLFEFETPDRGGYCVKKCINLIQAIMDKTRKKYIIKILINEKNCSFHLKILFFIFQSNSDSI